MVCAHEGCGAKITSDQCVVRGVINGYAKKIVRALNGVLTLRWRSQRLINLNETIARLMRWYGKSCAASFFIESWAAILFYIDGDFFDGFNISYRFWGSAGGLQVVEGYGVVEYGCACVRFGKSNFKS